MLDEMVINLGYFAASAAATAVVAYTVKWIFTPRDDDMNRTDLGRTRQPARATGEDGRSGGEGGPS